MATENRVPQDDQLSAEERYKLSVRAAERVVSKIKAELMAAKYQLEATRGDVKRLEGELAASMNELCLAVRGQGGLFDLSAEPVDKPGQQKDPDRWRKYPLTQLDLRAGLVQKLAEKDLFTLGDVAAWCEKKRLIDVPGIGEAGAKEIEDGLEAFWMRWNTDNPSDPEPDGDMNPQED